MSRLKRSSLVVTAVFAAMAVTACKKEEQAAKKVPAIVGQQSGSGAQGKVVQYSFEEGTDRWTGNGSIIVGNTTEKKGSGKGALKISGTSGPDQWSFAVSPKFGLEPGTRYRLTGLVLVDGINHPNFPPLLKCGIYQDGTWLVNAFTNKYDLKKSGWQQLSVTFTAPAQPNLKGFVGVEKGTKEALSGTIYLDDVEIKKVQ